MDSFDPDRRRVLALATLGGTLAACGGGASIADATPTQPGLPTTPPDWPRPLGAITSTAFVAAVSGQVPLAFGQVFKQGDLPEGSTLAGLQVDVKTRWPDRSAAVALVSGLEQASAGTLAYVALQAGPAAGGAVLTTADLRATGITAAVTAGSLGSASWAGDDWAAPLETWAAGPLMASWVYRKPVGSDAHLVAWLEVRLWRGGAVEVLPWVENGYLMLPGPTSKAAVYTFVLGGRERFSRSIDLPHHTRTPLVAGNITSHWLGGAQDTVYKHDRAYLQSTGLVPTYLAQTPANAPVVAALPATYTPLQQGSWPSGMGAGGYHASIGLLPEWDVLHLTCAAASTYKALLFNAYSAGRYPYHYRDEATGLPPRLADHPTLTIRDPSPGWLTPPGATGTAPPHWSLTHQPSPGYLAYLVTGRRYLLQELQFAAATNTLMVAYPHRESGKGIFKSQNAGAARLVAWCWRTIAQAYAVTPEGDPLRASLGAVLAANIDWYHGRYIAQPTNPHGFIESYGDYNGGIAGTCDDGCTTSAIVVRPGALYGKGYNLTADDQYAGWTLRIGSGAAAQTRRITGYTMATETLRIDPPLPAAPAAGTSIEVYDGVLFASPWMDDFVTAVWGYAKDIAIGMPAATLARLDALFEWKARSIVGRFGSAAADQFLWRDAAPYSIAIAPSDNPDYAGGSGPWYQNFGQIYAATWGGKTSDAGGKPPPYKALGPRVDGADLRVWLSPEGYLANALPALAYAVRHRAAGAQAAWQRLASASNWNQFEQGLHRQPVWAVAPGVASASPAQPAPAVRPAWNRGQTAGQWREIAGSSMALLAPANEARASNGVRAIVGPNARLDAWCGLSADTRTSEVWSLANGGHGDYYGNEVCKIDLMADAPAWAEWMAGSRGNVVDIDSRPASEHPSLGRYLDGLPCSTHSYYGQQFIERHDRALRLGGSIAPTGTGWQDVEAYNVRTPRGGNGWDPAHTYPPVFGSPGWTGALGFCACKDPLTERIYVVVTPRVRRFTPAASGIGGVWEILGPPPAPLNSGALGATAIDTRRNRLLWVKGWGPNQPYTFDLASLQWTAREHPAGGAKAAFDALTPSLGMVYVPPLDAFLVRANAAGPAIYRIDAATLAVTLLPTSGGDALPRGAVLTAEEGVYNRFLYLPRLGGVVYFPRAAANAWFLQLHDA